MRGFAVGHGLAQPFRLHTQGTPLEPDLGMRLEAQRATVFIVGEIALSGKTQRSSMASRD